MIPSRVNIYINIIETFNRETYNNSIDGQTTLINSLANECGTYGDGSTDDFRVRPGVINYLSSKDISPSFCGFMSETNFFRLYFYAFSLNFTILAALRLRLSSIAA